MFHKRHPLARVRRVLQIDDPLLPQPVLVLILILELELELERELQLELILVLILILLLEFLAPDRRGCRCW